jgi:chromosome segregation ATPase
MRLEFGLFTAEKLISYLQKKNSSLEGCLKKFPWAHIKKGETARLFDFIQKAEPDSQTAFLLLSYLVYAPKDVWLKAKAALMILGHPLIMISERKTYLEVIHEVLDQVQRVATVSESIGKDAEKTQFLQARFYEETGKYLILVDRRQNARDEYQKALTLYQNLNYVQKVEKISADIQKLDRDIIERTHTTLPTIEEQVKEQQNELEKFSSLLAMSQRKNSEAEAELAEKRKQLSEVQNQIEQANIALLKTQNEAGKVQAEAESQQKELQNELEKFSSLIEMSQRKNSEAEAELAEKRKQLSEVQNQVEQANIALLKTQNEAGMVQAEAESQQKEMQNELEKFSSLIAMSQRKNSEAEAELAEKRKQLSEVQNQIEQANIALLKTQNEASIVQTEAESLQDELQKKIQNKISILEKQSFEIEQGSERLSTLSQNIREQETALNELRQQVVEQQHAKVQLDEVITGLQQTIVELEDKKNSIMQAITPEIQGQADILTIRNEIKQLLSKHKNLEKEISSLQNRLITTQSILKQQEKEQVSLIENWSQVREQVDLLSEKRTQLLMDIERLESQKLELQKQKK